MILQCVALIEELCVSATVVFLSNHKILECALSSPGCHKMVKTT